MQTKPVVYVNHALAPSRLQIHEIPDPNSYFVSICASASLLIVSLPVLPYSSLIQKPAPPLRLLPLLLRLLALICLETHLIVIQQCHQLLALLYETLVQLATERLLCVAVHSGH